MHHIKNDFCSFRSNTSNKLTTRFKLLSFYQHNAMLAQHICLPVRNTSTVSNRLNGYSWFLAQILPSAYCIKELALSIHLCLLHNGHGVSCPEVHLQSLILVTLIDVCAIRWLMRFVILFLTKQKPCQCEQH